MLRFLASRFIRDWRNLIPSIMVLGFILVAALAPVISPPLDKNDPAYNRVGGFVDPPKPPNKEFLLGTYTGGLDVFHTLVWGTRSALFFGLKVALATAVIGILVGAGSSVLGGVFGRIGMRVTDAFLAFPTLAGIMLFSQLLTPITLGAGSDPIPLSPLQALAARLTIDPVTLALIAFSWMSYSRLAYASIEQQKEQEYVASAKVVGLSQWRILFRHILPNILSPLVVLLSRDIGGMVILESAFVFIGIKPLAFSAMDGFSVPTIPTGPEWGQMLADAKNWIIGPTLGFAYWWTFIPVTLALILFSVSWQLLGQRINSTVNPRTYSFLK